jgi:hypothetical protein
MLGWARLGLFHIRFRPGTAVAGRGSIESGCTNREQLAHLRQTAWGWHGEYSLLLILTLCCHAVTQLMNN